MRVGLLILITMLAAESVAPAGDSVSGTYVEARTCQVYTGPCFANGEVGSVGKNAIMTWKIVDGRFAGIDLTGQSVAVIVRASDTLGFRGLDDARSKKAILVINASAEDRQAAALTSFALQQTGLTKDDIADTERADIAMEFDKGALTATVHVDKFAQLTTRKARPGDCICSNESAYYPPLTQLTGCVPGVTIDGEVTARKLGTRWSIPDSRTAYLGTFKITETDQRVADSL